MTKVNVQAKGPVRRSITVNQDEEGISSVDEETKADGMKSLENERVAELIVSGKRELCEYIISLEDSDYYITDIEEWEVTLTGRDESLPIAMAADVASDKGEYENSVEALISWSGQDEFPFSRKASWISKRAVQQERLDDLEDFYREELGI